MPDFNTSDIVSAQRSIRSMERPLKVNAIPDVKPTTHNSAAVLGETLSMQQKYLQSFKLYIAQNIPLYMYVLKINVGCISTWDKFVDCNYEKNIYKYSVEYDYGKICICSLHKHYWQNSCVMLNFAGSIKNANLEKVA